MSERQNLTDVPAREQPDQVNGQEQGDKDQLTNEMHHDKPTPSKTVNHIYNYPMVHQLCGHLLEWTIPRWGYLLTETYTQKVVKPIVDVGLKFPGANIVTRVADSIDGYSNSLLDTVDIMFPITTKSAQHNWEDAKSAAEHVREAFRSDLQKMGDTMPNRAKAVLTTTIRCGSSVVVTFSDSIVKVSAKANQFVQEGTDKLRRNGQHALDATRKRGQQFYDGAARRLDKAADGAQALANEAQQKIQTTAKDLRDHTEDIRNQTEDIENRTNGQSGSME